jgi:hypothetical protein
MNAQARPVDDPTLPMSICVVIAGICVMLASLLYIL